MLKKTIETTATALMANPHFPNPDSALVFDLDERLTRRLLLDNLQKGPIGMFFRPENICPPMASA